MQNKKILILINNFGVGGAERLVIDQCNEILTNHSSLTLKVISLKKEPFNTLSHHLDQSVDWQCINFKGFFDLESLFFLYKKIIDFKPDILFTHLWFSNFIGRVIGKLGGVKKVVSFEHNVYDTVKTKKMFLVDFFLQFFSYRIIAVSFAVKISLINHGIKNKKIVVLPNGIDISKYKDIESIPEGLETKKNFTFIFIGRLIHQKGVDILLEAFSKIKGAKLLIVGSGVEEAKYKALSKDLKIIDRVNFLGNRKDIPELLSYSDCFVLPSRYEGMPMVLLEAMASGKTIIVSDFGSATELIRHRDNGFIFKKEDVEELSSLMYDISLGSVKVSISDSDRFKISINKNVGNLLKISNF